MDSIQQRRVVICNSLLSQNLRRDAKEKQDKPLSGRAASAAYQQFLSPVVKVGEMEQLF
jgi:hypothetical protein